MSVTRWVLPSDVGRLSEPQEAILAEVAKRLEQKGNPEYADFLLLSIRWATEEVLVNHVKHGNKHDLKKRVNIGYEINGDELKIFSSDEGEGFNPDDVPDCTQNTEKLSGRGIQVTKDFVAQFRGQLNYLGRGNETEIIFILDEPIKSA